MNHAALCARLPHAGRMCLLERLAAWDQDSITCLASSHRDADNPLRSSGRLPAVTGVEYAAQAMALHGSLLMNAEREATSAGTNAGAIFPPDAQPAMGYLASIRDLKLDIEDLAKVTDDLQVTARRLSADAGGFIYEFEIHGGERQLLSGRVTAKLVSAGEPV